MTVTVKDSHSQLTCGVYENMEDAKEHWYIPDYAVVETSENGDLTVYLVD